MGTRKVFLPEYNIWATEVDINVTCNDWDYFLGCGTSEDLGRLLTTQIEHENYEMAELIKKHIELKKK